MLKIKEGFTDEFISIIIKNASVGKPIPKLIQKLLKRDPILKKALSDLEKNTDVIRKIADKKRKEDPERYAELERIVMRSF